MHPNLHLPEIEPEEMPDARRLRITRTRPPEAEREYAVKFDRDGATVGYATGIRWMFQLYQMAGCIFRAAFCLRATHWELEKPKKGNNSDAA